MLSREDIATAKDFALEIVTVPQWGGEVGVRSMTIANRDEQQIAYMRLQGDLPGLAGGSDAARRLNPELLRDMQVSMLSYCLCDGEGQLLFDDEEGRAILRQKDAQVIQELYDVAMRVNKMTDEAFEAEKKDLSAIRSNGL